LINATLRTTYLVVTLQWLSAFRNTQHDNANVNNRCLKQRERTKNENNKFMKTSGRNECH